jgi:hypothetical protein
MNIKVVMAQTAVIGIQAAAWVFAVLIAVTGGVAQLQDGLHLKGTTRIEVVGDQEVAVKEESIWEEAPVLLVIPCTVAVFILGVIMDKLAEHAFALSDWLMRDMVLGVYVARLGAMRDTVLTSSKDVCAFVDYMGRWMRLVGATCLNTALIAVALTVLLAARGTGMPDGRRTAIFAGIVAAQIAFAVSLAWVVGTQAVYYEKIKRAFIGIVARNRG